MKKNETHSKWIQAAYQEFAEFGPDFSLKSLSARADLPRATFYYHFLNKEELISELLACHRRINDEFQTELRNIKRLIPDLYEMLYPHQTSLKFHKQLQKNSHIPKYNDLYVASNKDSINTLLPNIKEYFGFEAADKEIFKFYNTLTDTWYSRLDFSNFSVATMSALAEEIMGDVLKLTRYKNP